ncbi:hypothetical protein HK105_202405 [Polyrhizophydium stewartii]|uniref:Uncharacterized protein n=1 Tax=Polyrhizophydium stewartii TaxID=2732419 RepID=A0ABR4NEP8_9FUNG
MNPHRFAPPPGLADGDRADRHFRAANVGCQRGFVSLPVLPLSDVAICLSNIASSQRLPHDAKQHLFDNLWQAAMHERAVCDERMRNVITITLINRRRQRSNERFDAIVQLAVALHAAKAAAMPQHQLRGEGAVIAEISMIVVDLEDMFWVNGGLIVARSIAPALVEHYKATCTNSESFVVSAVPLLRMLPASNQQRLKRLLMHCSGIVRGSANAVAQIKAISMALLPCVLDVEGLTPDVAARFWGVLGCFVLYADWVVAAMAGPGAGASCTCCFPTAPHENGRGSGHQRGDASRRGVPRQTAADDATDEIKAITGGRAASAHGESLASRGSSKQGMGEYALNDKPLIGLGLVFDDDVDNDEAEDAKRADNAECSAAVRYNEPASTRTADVAVNNINDVGGRGCQAESDLGEITKDVESAEIRSNIGDIAEPMRTASASPAAPSGIDCTIRGNPRLNIADTCAISCRTPSPRCGDVVAKSVLCDTHGPVAEHGAKDSARDDAVVGGDEQPASDGGKTTAGTTAAAAPADLTSGSVEAIRITADATGDVHLETTSDAPAPATSALATTDAAPGQLGVLDAQQVSDVTLGAARARMRLFKQRALGYLHHLGFRLTRVFCLPAAVPPQPAAQ